MPAQIDPNIALGVKPAQIDPIQSLGQIYALKNAGVRSQLEQQAVQQGQYSLAQAGQQQQDAQAGRAAISANTSTDPNTGMATLNRAGYLGQLAQTAPGQYLGASQAFTQQDLANQRAAADYQKTQLANAKAHTDFVGSLLQGVTDQATYTSALNAGISAGIVKPGEMPAVYDPQLVQRQLQQTMTQKDAIDQQQKKLELQEKTKNDQATRDETATRDTNATTDRASERKIQQQNANTEAGRLNVEKQKFGSDQGASVEAQAQQIANGDVKPLSLSRSNPYSKAVMARAYEINPKLSDSLYAATQDLRSSKPTSMGGNVSRLGTAILHADDALKGSGDLGFSTGLMTGVGTEGTASYRQSAEFLTGEIGQYVEGGKLTNGQGNDLKKDLFSSRQGVRDSAIHQIINLSSGKLKSQMEQYKNATQNDFPSDRVFNDPTISGALHKYGIIGNDSQPSSGAQAPPVATHRFNTATGKIEAIQ
jgi:hypothetical protein